MVRFFRNSRDKAAALEFVTGIFFGSIAACRKDWYVHFYCGYFGSRSFEKFFFGTTAKSGYITGFGLGYAVARAAGMMMLQSEQGLDQCPLLEDTCAPLTAFQYK